MPGSVFNAEISACRDGGVDIYFFMYKKTVMNALKILLKDHAIAECGKVLNLEPQSKRGAPSFPEKTC
jgi:hypothetical protein